MSANFGCKRNAAGYMTPNPDYRCAWDDRIPQSEDKVGPDKLEVVASFCYLGDMLSAGGGCEIVVTTCVKLQRRPGKSSGSYY